MTSIFGHYGVTATDIVLWPNGELAEVYRALFEAMDAPSTVHLEETTWRKRDEYDDLTPRAEELISIDARCRTLGESPAI